jgi:hypothetical protein
MLGHDENRPVKPIVYVAAPWENKVAAAYIAQKFVDLGFEINCRWWTHKDTDDHAELQSQAVEDLDSIGLADFFVVLNTTQSEGKAFETGVAYTIGLPVVVIGGRSNIFHHLSDMAVVKTVADAVKVGEKWLKEEWRTVFNISDADASSFQMDPDQPVRSTQPRFQES